MRVSTGEDFVPRFGAAASLDIFIIIIKRATWTSGERFFRHMATLTRTPHRKLRTHGPRPAATEYRRYPFVLSQVLTARAPMSRLSCVCCDDWRRERLCRVDAITVSSSTKRKRYSRFLRCPFDAVVFFFFFVPSFDFFRRLQVLIGNILFFAHPSSSSPSPRPKRNTVPRGAPTRPRPVCVATASFVVGFCSRPFFCRLAAAA